MVNVLEQEDSGIDIHLGASKNVFFGNLVATFTGNRHSLIAGIRADSLGRDTQTLAKRVERCAGLSCVGMRDYSL